jgi:hypothetical protein
MFDPSKFSTGTPRLDGSTLWGNGHTTATLERYKPFKSKYLGHSLKGKPAFMLGRRGKASHTAIIVDGTVYIIQTSPIEVWKNKTDCVVKAELGEFLEKWETEGSYGWGMKIARRLEGLG